MFLRYLSVQPMNCYCLYFVHRIKTAVFRLPIIPILLTILNPSFRFLIPKFETLCLDFISLTHSATTFFPFAPK
jgi:hypothetical protein